MADVNGIIVHVETPTGSEAVGRILPFNIQPPADQQEGDLGGIRVKFARSYGQVVSVQAKTRAEAEILIKVLGPR